ncbi:MAG: hypothetical protein A3K65_06565 [Euryarchaeota archaeon RBG_16_68_12]|nr:MAG: hypothetical protein A3K65_06565 [Euryarchaeota archaeon RBG_16_68_12]
MPRRVSLLEVASLAVALLVLSLALPSPPPAPPAEDGYGPVPEFHLSASCPDSAVQPEAGEGGIRLPVAPDSEDCPKNFMDAVSTSRIGAGLRFRAAFRGAAVAPNPSDEIAVFAADDTVSWVGKEFGFRCSLADGVLYGYMQDGTHRPDGYTFLRNVPLGVCDGTVHEYVARARSVGGSNAAEFFVDGVRVGRIVRLGPESYADGRYTMVATTHRWEGGWDSTGLGLTLLGIEGL